jgi:hypothetical protein
MLWAHRRGPAVQEGLYKVDFHTVHGSGSGVICAIGGKLRGGNSAFAFLGNYNCDGETISAKVSTQRHNFDPGFKPLFGTDQITLTLKGVACGDMESISRARRCNCRASPSARRSH